MKYTAMAVLAVMFGGLVYMAVDATWTGIGAAKKAATELKHRTVHFESTYDVSPDDHLGFEHILQNKNDRSAE